MKQQDSKLNKIISYFKENKKKRNTILGGVAVCLLIAVCTSTYSYFSAKDKVVNKLDVSDLSFEIEEPNWEEPNTPVKPGDVLPKDPQIVNTGEISFVTRVRIEEVWTPKDTTDTTLETMKNKDYVRYLSYVPSTTQPTQQELLEILKEDEGKAEEQKQFALRLNLNAEQNGWYRGSSENSEWLYYNKILKTGERTTPVFNAVTIRTAEDFNKLANTNVSQTSVLNDVEAENARILSMNETPTEVTNDTGTSGTSTIENTTNNSAISNIASENTTELLDMPTVLTDVIVDTYQTNIEDYNSMLAKYNLQIYVYAETVQASAFAWNDAWGDDLPSDWDSSWGGNTASTQAEPTELNSTEAETTNEASTQSEPVENTTSTEVEPKQAEPTDTTSTQTEPINRETVQGGTTQ